MNWSVSYLLSFRYLTHSEAVAMLPRVTAPDSGIQHLEENCKININSNDKGCGTLYISEERLIWRDNESRGVSLSYRDIAIHAVSKDTQAFPEECLYVMYNGEIAEAAQTVNGGAHAESSDESDADSSGTISEIRFVPQCKDHLKQMFEAMSDCQCLHPDSEDSDDYYEGGGEGDGSLEGYEGAVYNPTIYQDSGAGEGFYTTEEGFEHLTPAGRATLQRLENMLADSDAPENDAVAQMEGVRIHDDEPQYPDDEPPIVGREGPMEEEVTSDQQTRDMVEGQFDDAD